MAGALWDTLWYIDQNGQTVGDWAVSNPDAEPLNQGGLEARDELATAIIIALFSNAKLPDEMIDNYGLTKTDQTEWHGNTFNIGEFESVLGSYLWTLKRAPLDDNTAALAEHFAAEALQPLVKQKKVGHFRILSEIDKPNGVLRLTIQAFGILNSPDRTFFADLFTLQ